MNWLTRLRDHLRSYSDGDVAWLRHKARLRPLAKLSEKERRAIRGFSDDELLALEAGEMAVRPPVISVDAGP
jgi:hypothetical protein